MRSRAWGGSGIFRGCSSEFLTGLVFTDGLLGLSGFMALFDLLDNGDVRDGGLEVLVLLVASL
jgi:hypothetical protein